MKAPAPPRRGETAYPPRHHPSLPSTPQLDLPIVTSLPLTGKKRRIRTALPVPSCGAAAAPRGRVMYQGLGCNASDYPGVAGPREAEETTTMATSKPMQLG